MSPLDPTPPRGAGPAAPELSQQALDALAEQAARLTGFSPDAILPEAIRRAARGLLRPGGSAEELVSRAAADDPAVVHALCQAVSVGETFFFRHPEHFRFLAGTVLPERLERGATRLSCWSAGCATGEEAYSIAACLLDLLPWPPTMKISVLGTDLLSRNLALARAATYGAWSQRPSAPLLHPLFHPVTTSPGAPPQVAIDDRVRAVVRFAEHNLLSALGASLGGSFDVIFCRNVLVYFAPQAIRRAAAHLADALAPGGVLVFGSMDVGEPPPGLVPEGPSEAQIFRKPDPSRKPAPLRPGSARPADSLPARPLRRAPPEPIALHLRALVHIDRGDRKVAERELAELVAQVPDYVPGLLERALLHLRHGERSAAAALMREVVKRTEKLPPEELLPGPEPLPVSFYRDSARTYLRGGAT